MRRNFLVFLCLFWVVMALGPTWIHAAVTGKISGVVNDVETGEALFPANVVVLGTNMGAATLRDGEYFIINVPPGTYTVRAMMMGYRAMDVTNVDVVADFTTTVDFQLEKTAVATLEPITVSAERPLIQPDMTATTRFITSEDLDHLPTRGYQEAAFLQTGVVQFSLQPDLDITDSESSNQPLLNIRGGRYNEIAYYVDGFSQQDPLTGLSSTSINQSAIEDVTVQTGGFNAEYGGIMSGTVNVITKEGGDEYSGTFEAVTDNLAGDWISTKPYDYNLYDFSLGGPGLFVPLAKDKANFYLSGERRWGEDREPKSTADGILPNNSLGGWSWQGKLTYHPTNNIKFRLGSLGSFDAWREFRNVYRFDIDHAPRYEDLNYSGTASMTHTLSPRAFYTLAGSYFLTDRKRGDGMYFDDLAAYSRPNGNPTFNQYLRLFYDKDDPTTAPEIDRQGTVLSDDEAHVWDDYLHRTSSYWGLKFDYTDQVTTEHQLKLGLEVQRHSLRYYRHVLPVQVRLVDSTVTAYQDEFDSPFKDDRYDTVWYYSDPNSFVQDADYYGYYWAVTDSQLIEPAHWDWYFTEDDTGAVIDVDSVWVMDYYKYSFDEKNVNSGRQGVKHPITGSAYIQDKFEYEGVVINAGVRYDYLNVDTQALKNEDLPLGADKTTLDPQDLTDNKIQHAVSPRIGIGFPVSDRTLFHANYGKFFQQPNLEDLYVSYDYLEYMIRWNPYYSPFGNPNLKPEKTTAYEVGIARQVGDRARLDLVAYYKDVRDLVEVRNVPSEPNAFATYRNTDYGTIKGVDVGFSLARTQHIAAELAYSLSWAMGTGSVSNTQTNVAWTGEEAPKQTAPLAFDQRHKISMNLDVRFEQGEGPVLGGMKPLQNAGINLLVNIGSGQPYTPTFTWNEVTLAAVSVTPSGPINSEYGPWRYRLDVEANKGFYFGRSHLDFYVNVLNLFNSDNATYVYQSTGSPDDTGWLNTAEGEKWLSDNGVTAKNLYDLAQRNPNNFSMPRMVRFGLKTSF
jgi:outer membrane receptor protein involved in Fe transport